MKSVLIAGFCLMSLILGFGCESAQKTRDDAPLTMRVLDRDKESTQYLLYVLEKDHAFSGSGGMPALQDQVTWKMNATPQDEARLLGLAESAGWLSGKPVEAPGDGPRQLVVSLKSSEGRHAFILNADGRVFPRQTEAILNALKSISDRRLKGYLDSLPKAGEPIRAR